MSNYSNNTPANETGVELDWGRPGTKWHKEVKALYLSFKDNEFSKFFYQTDIHMMRLLCEQHSLAFINPDMTAAGWKVINEQWGKFGATMRDRRDSNLVIAKTQAAEDYSVDLKAITDNAFDGDDD